MVLIDTSVLIDFFNGKKQSQVKELFRLIESDEDIAVCGLIVQEVLQGIRDDRSYKELKEGLNNFIYLNCPNHLYIMSADIYRKLRKKGITIRKSVDVLIAAIAIEHGVSLLENDRDFKNISRHTLLKLAEH